MQQTLFPFSAIVGQEEMKLALLVNAVDPSIGGVLIRGHKGTAKSTAVRGLAELLPPERVVARCAFRCHPEMSEDWCPACQERASKGEPIPVGDEATPVVELPLNASEDRVVGSLDIEVALKQGERAFQPGLLAAAHRGILYVDEVNLLEDHLVDILLDVAASGVNVVEREGIAYSHPARFLLVGTMNPEEGDLRPQLLDRFGLCVEVETATGREVRRAVVERALAFQRNADSFRQIWEEAQEALRSRIRQARHQVRSNQPNRDLIDFVARVAEEVGVDGHRAEIAMLKTAVAAAALAGRSEPDLMELRDAMALALRHRVKRLPMEQASLDLAALDRFAGEFLARRHL
jgi:Mg-chelatase subunit ChlI